MRILYIGAYNEYLNPTDRNYLTIFRKLNAYFFGPGFSDEKTLKEGLNAYIERHGGFDIVVDDICFPYFSTQPINAKYLNEYRKYRFIHYPIEHIYYLPAIARDIASLKNTNLVFKEMFDFHNFPTYIMKAYEEQGAYYIGMGTQYLVAMKDLPGIDKEKHVGLLNDDYYEFVNRYKHRTISFYHTIAPSEFRYSCLEHRKYDFSVEGVLYYQRRALREQVKQAKEITMPRRIHNFAYSLFNRLGLKPYSNIVTMKLYNFIFEEHLATSKISFTDGSQYKTAIRKFFEIPANKSLLLCVAPYGFSDMGFKENVHYVELDLGDPIRQIKDLLRNIKDYEGVAAAAQDLVYKKHSTESMAGYLRDSFELIVNGSFNGTQWKDGDFVILKKELA